jgi:hypothetical protein
MRLVGLVLSNKKKGDGGSLKMVKNRQFGVFCGYSLCDFYIRKH